MGQTRLWPMKYPRAFSSPPFYIIKAAEDDLRKLYEKSGNKAKLISGLEKRMKYLQENGPLAVKHEEWFDRLTSANGELYEMRFSKMKNLGNLRIIYCFLKGDICLLHVFQERKDSDTDLAIKVSLERKRGLQ